MSLTVGKTQVGNSVILGINGNLNVKSPEGKDVIGSVFNEIIGSKAYERIILDFNNVDDIDNFGASIINKNCVAASSSGLIVNYFGADKQVEFVMGNLGCAARMNCGRAKVL